MFGRFRRPPAELDPLAGDERLVQVVRSQLPEADPATIAVVAAMAGLLGTVAYADRQYAPEEEARIRQELARVQGMTARGIQAICALLREHIIEISTVHTARFTRVLRELADRELRLEVLGVMLEIAAADGEIGNVETNVLRQVTGALGLEQGDYNELQRLHRERLAVLK